jgi:hypothetical protein
LSGLARTNRVCADAPGLEPPDLPEWPQHRAGAAARRRRRAAPSRHQRETAVPPL